MTAIISIPARMTSTRMAGKVMAPIAGTPALAFLVHRLRQVRGAEVVIATTSDPLDEPIHALAREMSCASVAGDPLDLMSRHALAATTHRADVICLAGADDPLLDPRVFEAVIDRMNHGDVAYVRTAGWPLGMNAWAWSANAMTEATAEATEQDEREHVIPFWQRRPSRYPSAVLTRPGPDLYDAYRLTLDGPDDLELLDRIATELAPANPLFGTDEVLDLLARHPEWAAINQGGLRGYAARAALYDLTPMDGGA